VNNPGFPTFPRVKEGKIGVTWAQKFPFPKTPWEITKALKEGPQEGRASFPKEVKDAPKIRNGSPS